MEPARIETEIHIRRRTINSATRDALIVLGLVLALFAISLVNLDTAPPLWWDEGWTLATARNWMQLGHYGQLLNGEPAPSGLSAAFPAVASIALSFKLFGVGGWQGRLPGLVYSAAALLLLYYLASRLFDRRVAIAALLLVLCGAPDPFLHPLYLGRQVLAEMPMMFYLLAGYVGFWLTLRRSQWFLPLAVGFWSIGLIAKVEAVPFWAVSLLIPILFALISRQKQRAGMMVVALVSSLLISQIWPWIQSVLSQWPLQATVSGLYDVTAIVLIESVRLTVFILALQLGLLPALGLAYGVWQFIRQRPSHMIADNVQLLRLMLLSLAGSWFIWYMFLSAGTPRYGFPAMFLGDLFAAALLSDVTDRFNWRSTVLRVSSAIKQRRFNARDVATVLVVSLVIAMFTLNLKWVSGELFQDPRQSNAAAEVAAYLNTRTSPAALIETYDSELFLYLNRRYHYPPDQLHVDLIRRLMQNYRPEAGYSQLDPSELSMLYDPLSADPDYLVVGLPTELWRRAYDAILATNAFQQVYANERYSVYQRTR